MNTHIDEIVEKAENFLFDIFRKYDKIRDFNQEKVLDAFIKNKIGMEHFSYVSGYGHDDMGRDAIDSVFADIFKKPSPVRSQVSVHFSIRPIAFSYSSSTALSSAAAAFHPTGAHISTAPRAAALNNFHLIFRCPHLISLSDGTKL